MIRVRLGLEDGALMISALRRIGRVNSLSLCTFPPRKGQMRIA